MDDTCGFILISTPTCLILSLDTLAFPAPLETIGPSGLSDNSVDSLRGLVWS